MEEGPPGTAPDRFLKDTHESPERGGREELQLESQEGQELSVGAAASQVVLNMNSEDQTTTSHEETGNTRGKRDATGGTHCGLKHRRKNLRAS